MATPSKVNSIVFKLDFIRSSSDLALPMQKCAYKWKVKHQRKVNRHSSKCPYFLTGGYQRQTTLTTILSLKPCISSVLPKPWQGPTGSFKNIFTRPIVVTLVIRDKLFAGKIFYLTPSVRPSMKVT